MIESGIRCPMNDDRLRVIKNQNRKKPAPEKKCEQMQKLTRLNEEKERRAKKTTDERQSVEGKNGKNKATKTQIRNQSVRGFLSNPGPISTKSDGRDLLFGFRRELINVRM